MVSFSHRSAFPLMFDGSALEKWWKSALVFKVYAREAGQKAVSRLPHLWMFTLGWHYTVLPFFCCLSECYFPSFVANYSFTCKKEMHRKPSKQIKSIHVHGVSIMTLSSFVVFLDKFCHAYNFNHWWKCVENGAGNENSASITSVASWHSPHLCVLAAGAGG